VIAKAPPPQGGTNGVDAEIKEAITAGSEAFAAGDLNQAMQIFGMVLQHAPDNAEALIGIARVYLKAGEPEQAQAALDMVPEDAHKNPDYVAAVAQLKLLTEAEGVDDVAALEQRLAANPNDHQARFDLAIANNAKGHRVEAAEALVALMRRDREWNEDGARKKLLEFFESWGAKDPATLRGRRMLSSLLFS
jgi:putative thioredoxin